MFTTTLALLAVGFLLSLFLGHCSKQLWKYGPYNANLRFRIYRSYLHWPTLSVLSVSFTMLTFFFTIFAWWKLIVIIPFAIVARSFMQGVANLFIHTYVEKEIEKRAEEERMWQLIPTVKLFRHEGGYPWRTRIDNPFPRLTSEECAPCRSVVVRMEPLELEPLKFD